MRIRKRGNSWTLTWELGRDPATGKRRQRHETFHGTKREAEARWREVQAELDREGKPPPPATVRELASSWISAIATSVKPATLVNYRYVLEQLVIPVYGDAQLEDLRAGELQSWINSLSSSHSRRTAALARAVMRQMMQSAVERGLLRRNPVLATKTPKQERQAISVWTPEEAARFLRSAEGHRLYPLFVLALATGLRQGELLGLEWENVDLDARRIYVVKQRSRVSGVAEPKTSRSVRSVDIDARTADILREHRRRQEEDRRLLGLPPTPLVFASEAGTYLNPSNVVRTMRTLIRRSGVKWIRFHDLRHTHATHLLLAGVNPKVVSERLGHASVGFTLDTYSHLLPSMQRQAAEAVSALIFADKHADN